MAQSLVVRAATTTQSIPELNYDITTTPVDLIATEGFLLSDVIDATSLLDKIEAGDVIVDSVDGIVWSSIGLDGEGGVTSVNGEQGAVVLDASEVDLTAGYAAVSGGAAVAASDPTETAVAKLDGRGAYYGMLVYESLGISTQTTTTLADKINATTPALEAGDYMIEVSYSWNCDSVTSDFVADLLLNSASVSGASPMHQQEPKDSANGGAGQVAGTGTDQRHGFSHRFKQTLAAGTHNLQLQYASSAAGVDASIWDAMVTVARIS